MRIAEHVYLVASGIQGCALTDDLDCNCYLFDSGAGLVLFDSGAGRDIGRIRAVIEADGLSVEDITHVFLTHGHADHSGGAAAIGAAGNARIVCGAGTGEVLSIGEAGISLDAARRAGVYPADYRYTAPVPDRIVGSGETLEIGRLQITALPTPGHSADHMSYVVNMTGTGFLVSGDALFHSGRIIYQATYDFDIGRSCKSIQTIAAQAFSGLLPGHGMFTVSAGERHVQAALAAIRAMSPPAPLQLVKL
ncbi:MBL fold metallo-hydrolase [Shinella sp.]|uniref:MBL fold metallo-hydrolase n=1 Tax=Shinella sp. TaxID=1870904 RepID=UPI0029A715A6|nr:MBL fold metallo-hydrolase [Shinella sp.]MDX3975341.1 MBL fold metallo-hydrolase [Shinella sp.]